MDKWDLIKEKIKIIKQTDKEIIKKNIFKRKYYNLFNTPLGEKKITSFEKKYKITLPEEYKYFITNISNGIIFYWNERHYSEQIIPLYNSYYIPFLNGKYDKRTALRKLKKKFPYDSNKTPKENNEILIKLSSSNFPYSPKNKSKNNSLQGSIFLRYGGCDIIYFMEVTGEKPGRVWMYEPDANDYEEDTFYDVVKIVFESFYDFLDSRLDIMIESNYRDLSNYEEQQNNN